MADDKPKIKEIQVPGYVRKPERDWKRCTECKVDIFVEANGKQYYHKLTCKHSDGIDYRR